MVETAGNKLRRERNRRGLSIQDVARATKIRPQQIADLEGDEYSNFANLAYARGFLVGYAKYLNVEVGSALEAFEDTSTFGLDDYQYLSDVPLGVYRAPARPMRRRRRQRRFVAAGSILGLCATVATVWFFVISYRRLGGDMAKLAARQEARERASRRGTVPPTDSKSPTDLRAGETIPVAAPVTESPAPSVAPVEERAVVTTATLAASDHGDAIRVSPVKLQQDYEAPILPLPGDGFPVRAVSQGTDLRGALAGVPGAALNGRDAAGSQPKIRAVGIIPNRLPADPFQGGAPQPVSNETLR